MSVPPELTEQQVVHWTGGASLDRGRSYFNRGNIHHPRRQGMTLKAECEGSRPVPYRVEITLGPQGIVSGECSCPVGGGARCKHAAALLLSWVNRPDDFHEVQDLHTALEQRSKAELITLIRKMVARHPELESLLELPLPGGSGKQRVNPETIRRQVSSIFNGAGDEWGAAWEVASQLEDLVSLGDDFAALGEWRNAATTYSTIAGEVLERYEEMSDEEGELIGVVNRCVEGLKGCVAAIEDPMEREPLLRALFDIYRWDVEFGGIGMGDDVPEILLDLATPEEKQMVAAWVRALLPEGESRSDSFHRQTYGGFLLDLEKDQLDDESYLRICRETGRLEDAVQRLLELDRVDEALTEARTGQDYDLLRLADMFAAFGHEDLAERLVRERAEHSQDRRLIEWLKNWMVKRDNVPEALKLSEVLFWSRPSLSGYQEMGELARKEGRWDKMRPRVFARLGKEKGHGLLTEIHLSEGEIDSALETLSQVRAPFGGWGMEPLSLRVARAAEDSRPREAIRLFVQAANALIEARGRSNYTLAASHLVRVKQLYEKLGEQSAWEVLIADIREKNRRLSALKEELKRAGL